jgi:hypothetical protein
MADSGIFRINPLQSWQRDAILKAAQVLRNRFGNPPEDAEVRALHDGLLEVLDPARRTLRLQRELSEAIRNTGVTDRKERRTRQRRVAERRKGEAGPPSETPERRAGERRSSDRRNRR